MLGLVFTTGAPGDVPANVQRERFQVGPSQGSVQQSWPVREAVPDLNEGGEGQYCLFQAPSLF